MKNGAGDASEQHAADRSMTPRADDDQIGIPLRREGHDLDRGLALQNLPVALDLPRLRCAHGFVDRQLRVGGLAREPALVEGLAEQAERPRLHVDEQDASVELARSSRPSSTAARPAADPSVAINRRFITSHLLDADTVASVLPEGIGEGADRCCGKAVTSLGSITDVLPACARAH